MRELHSVFEKAMGDERRGLIGWSIGMVAFGAYLMALFPTVRNNPDLKNLLESYPEAMRRMLSLRDFTTGAGYLQAEVFSFLAPLLFVMVGVMYGSDATSGEEDRHTIDLLLANPVARWRVVVEKGAALAVGLAAVCGALFVTLLVGDIAIGLDVGIGPVGGRDGGILPLRVRHRIAGADDRRGDRSTRARSRHQRGRSGGELPREHPRQHGEQASAATTALGLLPLARR